MPFSFRNRFPRRARRTAVRPSRWAQPAAIVALLALVGSVWILVSAAALEIGDLLLALLCVFIIAFAGWFVLTRRGLVRLLGAPGVLLGASGLVGYFYSQRWPLLVALGGMALFVFASRYAVRHDRTTLRAVHRRWRRVRPARQGVLIINPNSGGGKAKRFNLPEEAKKRGLSPCCSNPAPISET